WRDPELYDVVLSTERLSVDECVEEVASMMQKKCFQETPESMRKLGNLALEWSVRSALRRDERTADASFTVECADGVAKLTGVVDTQSEAGAASAVAGAVEGVKSVDNQLKAASSAASRFRREG